MFVLACLVQALTAKWTVYEETCIGLGVTSKELWPVEAKKSRKRSQL